MSKASTPSGKNKKNTSDTMQGASEEFPSPQTVASLQQELAAFAADARMGRIIPYLRRLALSPPQVLLLEGGSIQERLNAAHYWALLVNCDHAPDTDGELAPAPCLHCSSCLRLLCHIHRDLFFLDGLLGSIKIAEVREITHLLGEPPREARYRIIIFREAQALLEPAANALLKSLEEPHPATSFVLLAPQRERLLPTLVSRSMALTLPWPTAKHAAPGSEELAVWARRLCLFLESGREFFAHTGQKGAVNALMVQEICVLCQRAVAAALRGIPQETNKQPLHEIVSRLPLPRLRMLSEVLAECQESLDSMVNPTLVLEWLATRMYLLIHR